MNQNVSSLAGRCILITGAAKRLGAAIARETHARGANVVIHYRNSQAAAAELCDELNARCSNSAMIVQADLLDVQQHARLVDTAVKQFGRLDVLINSASTFYPTPMGNITNTQFDDLIGSNLKAPLFLAQAAAPHLRKTQGLIINMIDIHASRPLPEHPVYCAAKAGLLMLTKSLARELGPAIRVNGIAPGPVLWPEQGIASELQDEIIQKTALKRCGSPDDIARTALFFIQDAPFVTGQILAVDGGRSIGW
jgi:pteridine reductase